MVILPFLGFYQYLKNSIYIILGVILILNSRNVTSNTKTNQKTPVRRTAIRRQPENVEITQKEKEL